MWNRQSFEVRMKQENIDIRYWGRHGKAVADELEQKLNFKFNPEVRSFIEEIGNLEFLGYEIIIAGSEDGRCDCVTESEAIELLKDNQSAGVKIMDFAGLSYILHKDGSIKAYEPHYIQPDGILKSYDSLTSLVEALIES